MNHAGRTPVDPHGHVALRQVAAPGSVSAGMPSTPGLSAAEWIVSVGDRLDVLRRVPRWCGARARSRRDRRPEALPGRFALAGLVDAHAHPSVDVDERGPFLADRAHAEAKLDQYAARGVTIIRDVGGLNTVTLDFARNPMPGRPLVDRGRTVPVLARPLLPTDVLPDLGRPPGGRDPRGGRRGRGVDQDHRRLPAMG